ncbi:hypothetical protein [Agrobacterium tumefaciens]|uniref:hypothetical protein n=1 Tax=Agrobacterium tumefaciens TaxID=358 RepID=UPI0016592FF4|nr:hypothetical protein [Agrobacterium tumefaciens]QNP80978.1 hypothetical protein IAI05_06995 [Agrobacterium tumefaciens]
MAKNSILDYSTTPDNNTDIGGIGIQGTSAVNNFDNAFRTIMSQLADWTDGSTIASGTTTDLSTVKGMYVSVTGTSTITSFGTAKAGWVKYLRFTGAATLTYNATSMILPGAANITTLAGDFALFVSEGSGNWRCLEYSRASVLTRQTQRGQLYGLTLSNNVSDATNDIDIAVGECASDDTIPWLMTLSSSLTKRLDATWAVGSGNGGLDTGAITNGTYHLFLIQRSDTGVVDALFSNSATSPTMPTNYDRKRRIGSILRVAGTILAFVQRGDHFDFVTARTERNSTAAQASTLFSVGVPFGIVVQPKLSTVQSQGTSGNCQTLLGSAGGVLAQYTITSAAGESASAVIAGSIFTNASSQIQFAVEIFSGTLSLNTLTNFGWIDTRGK